MKTSGGAQKRADSRADQDPGGYASGAAAGEARQRRGRGSRSIASIGPGLLVFVGVFPEDGPEQIDWLADKTLDLRIFPDENKPMNRSVMDVGGDTAGGVSVHSGCGLESGKATGILLRQHHRKSPSRSSNNLFDALRARWSDVQTGRFGADMQVALVNDGPVTFLLER